MSQSPFSDTPQNPYQSPSAMNASYDPASAGTEEVSRRTVELLAATGPWVRFLSVLGFIGAALMVLAGIAMLVAGIAQAAPPEMVGAAFFYVVGGVLYAVGALYLWRYADGIRRLKLLRNVRSLEEALAAQKSFWKYTGILMAAVLVLYGVILAVALVFGIGMALR